MKLLLAGSEQSFQISASVAEQLPKIASSFLRKRWLVAKSKKNIAGAQKKQPFFRNYGNHKEHCKDSRSEKENSMSSSILPPLIPTSSMYRLHTPKQKTPRNHPLLRLPAYIAIFPSEETKKSGENHTETGQRRPINHSYTTEKKQKL